MADDRFAPRPVPNVTATGESSLATVVALIDADHRIADPRRRVLKSALQRLAWYLGRDPASIPARWDALRHGIAQLQPARLGITRKSAQNTVSLAKAGLREVGLLNASQRGAKALTPAWHALTNSLPTPRLQRGLSRFARHCSAKSIAPEDVDDTVVVQFIEATVASGFVRKPNKLHRQVAMCWNDASSIAVGWPQARLTVPSFRRPAHSIPWSASPRSFRADVDAYLDWLGGKVPLTEDAPLRPCKSSTLRLRRDQIQLAASAAVERGVPLEMLTDLAALVTPNTARSVLNAYLNRNDGKPKTFVIELAGALLSIANTWVKAPEADLKVLRSYCRKLNQHRRVGLTDKNLEVVRAMLDPANRARLLRLPGQLMAQARSGRLPRYRAAVRAQMAVVVELLTFAPMRVGNLVRLRLGDNVLRPAGIKGPVHIWIPADAVKNGVALEFPLPARSVGLIDAYAHHFHSRLAVPGVDWLFPGEDGDHKDERTLTQQLSKLLLAEFGVRITTHQFRHIAAALLLQLQPGNYEGARRLLGHKSVQTTVKFYVELESISAARQYAELLLSAETREPQREVARP